VASASEHYRRPKFQAAAAAAAAADRPAKTPAVNTPLAAQSDAQETPAHHHSQEASDHPQFPTRYSSSCQQTLPELQPSLSLLCCCQGAICYQYDCPKKKPPAAKPGASLQSIAGSSFDLGRDRLASLIGNLDRRLDRNRQPDRYLQFDEPRNRI
jgi:hypothetical protein